MLPRTTNADIDARESLINEIPSNSDDYESHNHSASKFPKNFKYVHRYLDVTCLFVLTGMKLICDILITPLIL